ncbi:hypothetical protein Tco_0463152 [Tanacetum coccineum]
MALGNKKSVDDAAFERIYKRIQYNTIYTYMKFQYDEMVVEPVAEVVKSVLEPDIDDQILSAFMELDPVFNLADVDTDIESWNPYFTIDSFASITNPHAYYNMDKVHIDFVWFDQNANKLYYFLHDKDDEKIAAEVSPNLVASYKEKDFAQTFVSIINFQVGFVDPTKYPRYQNYSFVRRDWLIQVNSNTVITENPFSEETGFQMHTWIPSIRYYWRSYSRRLTKTKVFKPVEIWLRDLTGVEIKFVSNHTLRKVAIRIAKVIQEYGTIYLTRVMLVHTKSGNLLVDTELIGVEIDPAFHKS